MRLRLLLGFVFASIFAQGQGLKPKVFRAYRPEDVIMKDSLQSTINASVIPQLPPSKIATNSSNRFVSQAMIDNWNAATSGGGGSGTNTNFSVNEPAQWLLETRTYNRNPILDEYCDSILFYKAAAYGAKATATLSGTSIASITINTGGSEYTTAPTVLIVPSNATHPTSTATATATISGGVVTGITITNPGAGYTAAPKVRIIGSTYYRRLLYNWKANLNWWGVQANTGTNQFTGFQKAADDCIFYGVPGLQMDNGYVTVSQGVVFRRPFIYDTLGMTKFCSLSLYGSGNCYDPDNIGSAIVVTDPTECALYLQKMKGGTIENIHFLGRNTGLLNYSYMDVINEKDNFLTNGVSGLNTAAHTAIAIDRFSFPGTTNKHTNKLKYYNEPDIAGSTNIKIIDCYFSYWVVGISISGSGLQNGENITILRPYITCCRDGIATGDIQNRTVKVEGYVGWNKILNHFNSLDYGGGMPPTVYGLNIASDTKYLCRLSGWYGNAFRVYGTGHTELMYSIGGYPNGKEGDIYLYDMDIYLTGAIDVGSNGGHNVTRHAAQICQASTLVFTNCTITEYTGSKSMIGILSNYTILTNTHTTSPILQSGGGTVEYQGASTWIYYNKKWTDLTAVSSHYQFGTVISMDTTTGKWKFRDGFNGIAGANGEIQATAFVQIFPKNGTDMRGDYSGTDQRWTGAGQVLGKSGDTVEVYGIPKGLYPGMTFDNITTKFSLQTP